MSPMKRNRALVSEYDGAQRINMKHNARNFLMMYHPLSLDFVRDDNTNNDI